MLVSGLELITFDLVLVRCLALLAWLIARIICNHALS